MLSFCSIYPLQTFQLAQDGRQWNISMVCHTDWIVQSMIFFSSHSEIFSEPYKVGRTAECPGSPVSPLVTDLQDSVRFWHGLLHSRFTCPWNVHTFLDYWLFVAQWQGNSMYCHASLSEFRERFPHFTWVCTELGRHTQFSGASFTWSCFALGNNLRI